MQYWDYEAKYDQLLTVVYLGTKLLTYILCVTLYILILTGMFFYFVKYSSHINNHIIIH